MGSINKQKEEQQEGRRSQAADDVSSRRGVGSWWLQDALIVSGVGGGGGETGEQQAGLDENMVLPFFCEEEKSVQGQSRGEVCVVKEQRMCLLVAFHILLCM